VIRNNELWVWDWEKVSRIRGLRDSGLGLEIGDKRYGSKKIVLDPLFVFKKMSYFHI
jgi:hypothetical protein